VDFISVNCCSRVILCLLSIDAGFLSALIPPPPPPPADRVGIVMCCFRGKGVAEMVVWLQDFRSVCVRGCHLDNVGVEVILGLAGRELFTIDFNVVD
jgi:hypothetical protein